MERVFLDVNVLFSAAYQPDAGVRQLWRLPRVWLVTSAYAAEEARRNLPGAHQKRELETLLASMEIAPWSPAFPLPSGAAVLSDKDRPILQAAVQAGAYYLLTGDRRDFGAFYGKTLAGVRVLPPAAYLRRRRT